MSTSSLKWHVWDRIKLRAVSFSQLSLLEKQLFESHFGGLSEPSGSAQSFIHRLVLLLWINENELAQRVWEEEPRYHFLGDCLEDFLFKLIVYAKEGPGWGFRHPEFMRLVRYYVLGERQAFQLSTIAFSDLLRMDNPSFSSADGLIDVKFDKHELQRVADMVPQEYHKELRLPLILLGPIMHQYPEKYKVVGSKLENFLLQKLLKLTSAPSEKHNEVESIKWVQNISTLKRRKFNKIYQIFPNWEPSPIWLSVKYRHPDLPEP